MGTDEEYFCPTCRELVRNVRSGFGNSMSAVDDVPYVSMPIFRCEKCGTPVMKLSRSEGKRKLITEKGIVEID